jgi:hypothetical protein
VQMQERAQMQTSKRDASEMQMRGEGSNRLAGERTEEGGRAGKRNEKWLLANVRRRECLWSLMGVFERVNLNGRGFVGVEQCSRFSGLSALAAAIRSRENSCIRTTHSLRFRARWVYCRNIRAHTQSRAEESRTAAVEWRVQCKCKRGLKCKQAREMQVRCK